MQENKLGGYCHFTYSPICDENGKLVGSILSIENINELMVAEENFKNLFQNANDAIFIHDLEGHFLEVNKTACEHLGYSREELLQMTPMDINSPEFASLVPEKIKYLEQHGYALFEVAHVRRDGTTFPVEINSKVIQYNGKPAIFTIARNISERKESELLLSVQHDLNLELARISDINEACVKILQTCIKFRDIDCGGIYLVNQDTGAVDLQTHIGLSEAYVKNVAHYEPNSDNAKIVMNGSSIYFNHDSIAQVVQSDDILHVENLHSIFTVPLSKFEKTL